MIQRCECCDAYRAEADAIILRRMVEAEGLRAVIVRLTAVINDHAQAGCKCKFCVDAMAELKAAQND